MKKHTKRWSISFLVSFFFLFATVATIYYDYKLPIKPKALKTTNQTTDYINNLRHTFVDQDKPIYIIPTGIYLESLTVFSNNTVKGVGLIWQHLDEKTPISASGFQLRNAYNIKIDPIFHNSKDGKQLLVWHFEASFIKNVDPVMYPYDIETISFPILNKTFKNNTILVPDMTTKDKNSELNLGINPEIIMKSFSIKDIFFDYDILKNEPRVDGQHINFRTQIPVLRFNIILNRLSVPATITTITPMLFALIITFFIVLSITNTVNDINVKGTTYNDVLILLSFLIFIVVVAHQSFRAEILGNRVVFLDLVCYTLYFALFYAACLSYIRFIKTHIKLIQQLKENHYIYPKLFFLPMVFGLLFLGTLCLFFFN